jgi:hypothetical protein
MVSWMDCTQYNIVRLVKALALAQQWLCSAVCLTAWKGRPQKGARMQSNPELVHTTKVIHLQLMTSLLPLLSFKFCR